MSETFPQQIERLEHEGRLPAPEQHKTLAEHSIDQRQAAHEQAHTLEEARQQIAELREGETTKHIQEALQEPQNDSHAPSAHYIDSNLKQLTVARELKHLQRQLPASQRQLSKLIHTPVIRVASEAAGQTVSRPSGLLGGGLVALLGTSFYLYLAHHIGFRYNYGVFVVLFAGGFILGLLLELAVHMATASRRAHD